MIEAQQKTPEVDFSKPLIDEKLRKEIQEKLNNNQQLRAIEEQSNSPVKTITTPASNSILDLASKIKKDVKKHFKIDLEIEPVIV